MYFIVYFWICVISCKFTKVKWLVWTPLENCRNIVPSVLRVALNSHIMLRNINLSDGDEQKSQSRLFYMQSNFVKKKIQVKWIGSQRRYLQKNELHVKTVVIVILEIVFTILRMIWNLMDFRSVSNQSENGKYNLVSPFI